MYQCILGFLYRLRRDNQRWRIYPHMLVKENRWRAQRYGYDQGLVDFGKGEVVRAAANRLRSPRRAQKGSRRRAIELAFIIGLH